jgi:hypothetical protein
MGPFPEGSFLVKHGGGCRRRDRCDGRNGPDDTAGWAEKEKGGWQMRAYQPRGEITPWTGTATAAPALTSTSNDPLGPAED